MLHKHTWIGLREENGGLRFRPLDFSSDDIWKHEIEELQLGTV